MTMSASKRPWRTLASVAALALVVSACGGDGAEHDAQQDPKAALKEAVDALGEYDGVQLSATLHADEVARGDMMAEGEMDEEQLDLLLSSSLTIVATGEGDGEDATGEMELSVQVGDDTPAAIRMVDERFFIRADLPAFFEAIDEPELTGDLDGMTQMLPDDIGTALQEGGWMEIVGLDDLQETFAPDADVDQELDEEQAERIADRLSARFATFVDDDVDAEFVAEEDAGDRLRVSTTGQAASALMEDIVDIVASEAGSMVDGLGDFEQGMDELEGELEGDMDLDVWIDGGRISQVGINLMDIEDAPTDGEMLLLVAIEEFTGSVGVPDEVTEVDLMQVMMNIFMGGMGNMDLSDDEWMTDEAWDEEWMDDETVEDGTGDDGTDQGSIDGMLPEDDVEGTTDPSQGDVEGDDPVTGEPMADCIPDEEFEQLRELFSEDEMEQFEQMIEMGMLERC